MRKTFLESAKMVIAYVLLFGFVMKTNFSLYLSIINKHLLTKNGMNFLDIFDVFLDVVSYLKRTTNKQN